MYFLKLLTIPAGRWFFAGCLLVVLFLLFGLSPLHARWPDENVSMRAGGLMVGAAVFAQAYVTAQPERWDWHAGFDRTAGQWIHQYAAFLAVIGTLLGAMGDYLVGAMLS